MVTHYMSEKKSEIVIENQRILFDKIFEIERSELYRNIFREVYGDDYPEEANPDSFITLTELQAFAKRLNVGFEKTIIDLGCGRGGPGMWIARQTGANYIGIDFSKSAIEQATKKQGAFKMKGTVNFCIGNLYSLNFPENNFDGAVSIDVLSFIPNPYAVIKEVARILKPNAIFVFTTWEKENSQESSSYRSLLEDAGFEVISYSEPANWRERQREVYQKTLEIKDQLIKEIGRDGAFSYIMEAKRYLPIVNDLKRILAVAMKR
jgi:ubiquinone/menaquinone biosynthesis C-methylase UbiE